MEEGTPPRSLRPPPPPAPRPAARGAAPNAPPVLRPPPARRPILRSPSLRLRPRTSLRRRDDAGQHSSDGALTPRRDVAAPQRAGASPATDAVPEPRNLLIRCWQRPTRRVRRPRAGGWRVCWDDLPAARCRPPAAGPAADARPSADPPRTSSPGSSSSSAGPRSRPVGHGRDSHGPLGRGRWGRFPRGRQRGPSPPPQTRCVVNIWCCRQCHRGVLKQLLAHGALAEHFAWRRARGLPSYRVNPQLAIIAPGMATADDTDALLDCLLGRFLHRQRRGLMQLEEPPPSLGRS